MNKLSRRTILSLTLRTYFIRIFYNYNNLFGEGLCYCVFPFFKSCGVPKRDDILAKHLVTFNTNEYLSGFAVGIILKNSESNDADLEKTKNILSSVLGSIGDRLIYRLIFPVLTLTAVNKFVISGLKPDLCTWITIIFLIILFNLFNFYIRYAGISKGYEKGLDALRFFRSSGYKRTVFLLTSTRNILTVILLVELIIYLKASNILLFFFDRGLKL